MTGSEAVNTDNGNKERRKGVLTLYLRPRLEPGTRWDCSALDSQGQVRKIPFLIKCMKQCPSETGFGDQSTENSDAINPLKRRAPGLSSELEVGMSRPLVRL